MSRRPHPSAPAVAPTTVRGDDVGDGPSESDAPEAGVVRDASPDADDAREADSADAPEGMAPTTSEELPISTVSWGVQRLDVFFRGPNNSVYHKSWDGMWGPSYSAVESIGGVVAGAPDALSRGSQLFDVVVRGAAGDLLYKWYDGSNYQPSFQSWQSLGGNLVGRPSLVSWGPSRLDVFAVGGDGTMQHKWLDDSSLDAAKSDGTPGWQPSASSYESLGGPAGLGDRFTLGGGVKAVSRGVGTIDLFAVTSAGSLLHKSFDAGAWSPDWETVGTGIAGTPAVESVETSRLDVFVASSGSPATLRHKAWSGTTWPASWDEIGGPISGSPVTAITSPGNIDVFVTGADGALNFKSLSGNTWTPSMTGFISPDGVAPNLGGALLGSPSVASWGANRIDLFVAGPIHELYHRSYDPTPPNLGWMPNWEDLGGIVGW